MSAVYLSWFGNNITEILLSQDNFHCHHTMHTWFLGLVHTKHTHRKQRNQIQSKNKRLLVVSNSNSAVVMIIVNGYKSQNNNKKKIKIKKKVALFFSFFYSLILCCWWYFIIIMTNRTKCEKIIIIRNIHTHCMEYMLF